MSDSDEETIAILQRGDGRNKIGESELHELARSDDYQALKNAVAQLSEAVSFGKLSNARLLLMKGAKVNTKSTECLTDTNGDRTTASGLTPLMEACANGDVDMIKLLLQYKADVVLRDDDDWSAIEHLKEFLLLADALDPKRREKLEEVVRRMEDLHQKAGVKPKTREEFAELLELKRLRKIKHTQSQTLSASRCGTFSSGRTTSSFPDSLEDDDLPRRKRKAVTNISSDESDAEEDFEFEETRNLNEYRSVISGFRRNHKDKPSSSTKPAAVPVRKKGSILAKRAFFNFQ